MSPWLPRKRNDRRPSLRICLRSRSSIVACSMKQMHIALFGEIGRTQLSVYIYMYICIYIIYNWCLRACALPVHASRHPAAHDIYISKWRWSFAQRNAKPRYPLTDRAMIWERREFSSHSICLFVDSRIDNKMISFFCILLNHPHLKEMLRMFENTTWL